jgi:hypothetical protein
MSLFLIATVFLTTGCEGDSAALGAGGAGSSSLSMHRVAVIKDLAGRCQREDGDACNSLGDLYATTGWGGGKMVTVAKGLYDLACGYGNAEGCFQIGAWSYGCEQGNATSCELLDCMPDGAGPVGP